MDQETEHRLRTELKQLEEKLFALDENSLLEDWKDGIARLGFVNREFLTALLNDARQHKVGVLEFNISETA